MRVTIMTFASLSLLAGCASSSLRVESNPEGAEVAMIKDGSVPVGLGKTPLTVSKDLAPGLYSDHLAIIVAKEGFQTESMWVPRTFLQGEGRWSVTLKPLPYNTEWKEQENALNGVAQGIAETQRLIYLKNYGEAMRVLEQMTTKYPKVSVFYDFKGNIHYIQKDLERALSSYRRSLEIRPNNPETARMVEKISMIRGERVPTGRGN